MKAPIKILCLLLSLLFVLGAMAACGTKPPAPDDTGDPQTTSGDPGATTADPNQGTQDLSGVDTLAPQYDFRDAAFRILTRGSTSYEFDADENVSGALVSEETARRNSIVEERCNVNIEIFTEAGDWDNRDSFSTTIRTNGMSNTSSYELIAAHSAFIMDVAITGTALDFSTVPNIDITKKWWMKHYYDECNYNGAIYMMYGDLAYTLYEYMQVIFFNDTMAKAYHIEDLYDLGLEGDWTWEKFKEYTLMVNSDPEAGNLQEYGFLSNAHWQRSIPYALNMNFLERRSDDTFTLPAALDDVSDRIMTDILNFHVQNTGVYATGSYSNDWNVCNPIFSAGRALFYGQELGQSRNFRVTMKDIYGVLPNPKYDDNQLEYRTGIRDTVTGVMIPSNVANKEMAGTVTELLSMESRNHVVNAYYGKVLQVRTFNDQRCVEMLEIIRNSTVLAFAQAYSYTLGYPNSLMSGLITKGGETSPSTGYANSRNSWNTYLIAMYDTLDATAVKLQGK